MRIFGILKKSFVTPQTLEKRFMVIYLFMKFSEKRQKESSWPPNIWKKCTWPPNFFEKRSWPPKILISSMSSKKVNFPNANIFRVSRNIWWTKSIPKEPNHFSQKYSRPLEWPNPVTLFSNFFTFFMFVHHQHLHKQIPIGVIHFFREHIQASFGM